ncbi:adenylyl cyclase [Trypanosoma conorhini]|uniref:Adenylyl cyclase n=1 Tax=Trypanosoma conorhini TaxID=83891 RepID=A0A422NB25_9TRYP|nr:adenylyl cyclase [Trypanosoma conorhini]RNF02680.1 adenylyl cyclase [Trypanosoma conorhini]
MALSTAERGQVEVSALGAVALRGVPRPVEMYQLDAVPGRTFAALRCEKGEEADLDASVGDSNASGFTRNTCYDTSVRFISCLLSPYAPRQRAGVLASLCARWRVHGVERGVMSCDEHCSALVEVLARRVSRVYGRSVEPCAPISFLWSVASSTGSARVTCGGRSVCSVSQAAPPCVPGLQPIASPSGFAAQAPRELCGGPADVRPAALRGAGRRVRISPVSSESASVG